MADLSKRTPGYVDKSFFFGPPSISRGVIVQAKDAGEQKRTRGKFIWPINTKYRVHVRDVTHERTKVMYHRKQEEKKAGGEEVGGAVWIARKSES